MTQSSPQPSLKGSRLVRALSELSAAKVELSHKNFADRLGRLIDITDAIDLSTAQSKLASTVFQANISNPEEAGKRLSEQFLNVRVSIVQFIIKSFDPSGKDSWLPLPKLGGIHGRDQQSPLTAYQQFYSAHQREMDFKISRLRIDVRKTIVGLSPSLARLSALDSALSDTLAVHSRKLFATIPRLLAQRFDSLVETDQLAVTTKEGGATCPSVAALETFTGEMQEILLVELEARLQPVLGLIEAFNEEVNTIP